nr:MAG TPA_asm: hypothetical protein [Bacteriophage sp.]
MYQSNLAKSVKAAKRLAALFAFITHDGKKSSCVRYWATPDFNLS